MARLLKFLTQRNSFQNCVNKEISWNLFNYEYKIHQNNNNKNSNNSITCRQHYHNDKIIINNNNSSSNINRHHQQQLQKHVHNSSTTHNNNCSNLTLLQQHKLTAGSTAQQCFITVDTTTATVSVAGVYAGMTDATTLELKRKYHINKLLHARSSTSTSTSNNNSSASLDQRSMFYITLLVAIYCCVLIRASAATSANSVISDNAKATSESDIFFQTSISSNNATSMAGSSDILPHVAIDEFAVAAVNSEAAIQLHQRLERDAANVPDDDDDSSYHDDEFDEYEALINNKSAKGKYIGAPCDKNRCEPALLHVSCDKETQLCGCQKNYPVQLGLTKGCAKPKKLGEQCFYDETCIYNDENSLCVQVRHNAKCQCANGFHSVSYAKPTRRVFCTQDLKELKSDLPTLLGVSSGIAVLAGLICMVLHLFSKTKYPRHRNFGDANLPPPIMYSSETGIPLTVQSGRPSSRSSIRSSGSIGSYGNRRSSTNIQSTSGHIGGGGGGGGSSSAGSKGSRRPSLASVHSTSSSIRSYSMMRFEKETQQKEIRQEMKLRLARLQQQQHMSQNKPQIVIGDTLVHHHGALARISMSTPSPLTPNSLDELLPSVDETQELFHIKAEPNETLVNQMSDSALTTAATETARNAAYNGPCSSSTEAL